MAGVEQACVTEEERMEDEWIEAEEEEYNRTRGRSEGVVRVKKRMGECEFILQDKRKWRILLDTGATRSLISYSAFQKLNRASQSVTITKPLRSLRVRSASAHFMQVCGTTTLILEVGGRRVKQEFVVVTKFPTGILLGSDFLQHTGAVLDYHDQTVKFKNLSGVTVPLGEDNEWSQLQREDDAISLQIVHDLYLPPTTQTVCLVQAPLFGEFAGLHATGMVSSRPEMHAHAPLYVARGLVEMKAGTAKIAVANLGLSPMMVPAGTPIGLLAVIDPSVYEVIEKGGKRVSTSEMIEEMRSVCVTEEAAEPEKEEGEGEFAELARECQVVRCCLRESDMQLPEPGQETERAEEAQTVEAATAEQFDDQLASTLPTQFFTGRKSVLDMLPLHGGQVLRKLKERLPLLRTGEMPDEDPIYRVTSIRADAIVAAVPQQDWRTHALYFSSWRKPMSLFLPISAEQSQTFDRLQRQFDVVGRGKLVVTPLGVKGAWYCFEPSKEDVNRTSQPQEAETVLRVELPEPEGLLSAATAVPSFPEIVKKGTLEEREDLPAPMLGPAAADMTQPDLTHLQPEERDKMAGMLSKFGSVLHGDVGTPRLKLPKFGIKTTTDMPVSSRPYRFAHSEKIKVEEQIHSMLEKKVVSPSRSPWSSPVVLVRKKDGTIRFCVDYRKLNAVTVRDVYPLPRVDDTLALLGGARWFTCLDIESAYWQIPLDEDAKEKTAFICEFGLFQFNSLPFGLTNAPPGFQRIMDVVLAGLKYSSVLCYLDDIVIFSKDFDTHVKDVQEVLLRLEEFQLTLKPSKCQWAQSEIHYLGHVVSAEGVRPDQSKLAAVEHYPAPRNVKEIRSFVGFASYYRKFIFDFARIAAPLNKLLCKEQAWQWGPQEVRAFNKLKKALTSAPVLVHPDWNRPFLLQTDASDVGVAAILAQKDAEGKEHVICYLSRTLTPAEIKWPVHEREALAIVWSCEQFRPYLAHNPFTLIVQTDHANLDYMFQASHPPRLARWGVRMSEFEYRLEYRKGANNNADAPSRAPVPAGTPSPTGAQPPPEGGCAVYNTEPEQLLALDDLSLAEGKARKRAKARLAVSRERERAAQAWVGEQEARGMPRVPLSPGQGEWLKRQKEDGDCKHVARILLGESEARTSRDLARTRRYMLDGATGLLHFRGDREMTDGMPAAVLPVVVPRVLRTTVLSLFHDQPLMGHLGAHKMVAKMETRFHWPGMTRDAKLYVSACLPCRQFKAQAPRRQGHLQRYVAVQPFHTVHVDFVGPLPVSKRQNTNVCVMIDRFTRWVELAATKDQEAATAADCVMDSIVCRHGCPQSIVSDRGSAFISKLYQRLMRRLGIKSIVTTPHNPQANAQVERVNKVIKTTLTILSRPDLSDWDDYLQAAAFAYRTALVEPTGESPFMLLYGRHPRLPTDVLFGPQTAIDEDIGQYCLKQTEILRTAHERAVLNQLQAKEEGLARANERRKDTQLASGQRVLRWIGSLEAHEGRRFGLPRVDGPWRVLERAHADDSTVLYKIAHEVTKEVKTAHVNKLLLYPESVGSRPTAEEPAEQKEEPEEEHVTLQQRAAEAVRRWMPAPSAPQPAEAPQPVEAPRAQPRRAPAAPPAEAPPGEEEEEGEQPAQPRPISPSRRAVLLEEGKQEAEVPLDATAVENRPLRPVEHKLEGLEDEEKQAEERATKLAAARQQQRAKADARRSRPPPHAGKEGEIPRDLPDEEWRRKANLKKVPLNIVDQKERRKANSLKYLVRWSDGSHTWEVERDLEKGFVEEALKRAALSKPSL
jgi:transposase InsO family protein